MHRTLLFTAVIATGALALAAGGCTKKTDDHYEGKVKSDPGSGTSPSATPSTSPSATPDTAGATPNTPSGKNPRVVLKTSLGNIHIELFADKAPISVKNYLRYVDDKFYDNTIFHRVMPDFMIQGGGLTQDMQKKPTRAAIKNEAKNGLSNTRGTLAMARTGHPDSATAQFFINVTDNARLDHRGEGRQYGYCVFGRVTQGMDVVDKIRNTPTGSAEGRANVPTKPVLILQARRLK